MKRFFYYCLIFLLGATTSVYGQLDWQNEGPDNQGAKVRSMIYDAEGAILAATAGGGIWKSTNDGFSWSRLTGYDGNPAVTYLLRDGNTIYAATGETGFVQNRLAADGAFDPNNESGYLGYVGKPGSGIYVSTDNGATWSNDNATINDFSTLINRGPFVGIQKLERDSDGGLYIATTEGLFYSNDNLASVELQIGANEFRRGIIFDIAISGDVVIATTRDGAFIRTGNSGPFLRIEEEGLPAGGILGASRVAVEVSQSNPETIYLAGASATQLTGVWRSDDRGETWRRYAPIGAGDFTPVRTNARDAFLLEINPINPDVVYLGGTEWNVYAPETSWQQPVQYSFEGTSAYLPSRQYCILFAGDESFYVGTNALPMYTEDGGSSFFRRHKGLEAHRVVSVASLGTEGEEAIISGTASRGYMFNEFFNQAAYDPETNPSGPPAPQSHNAFNAVSYGDVSISAHYPGNAILQGSDGGVIKANADITETVYGLPINTDTTQVPIDTMGGTRDSTFIAALDGITGSDIFIDRPSAGGTPGGLNDNGKLARLQPFVLSEFVPESAVASASVTDLAELSEFPGADSIQRLPHYVFYASSRYIWLGNFVLGDPSGLLPRWDRITNATLLGPNSQIQGQNYYTSMAVIPDEEPTLFVGTSRGEVWRITGATDFDTYDATANGPNVRNLMISAPSSYGGAKNRPVTSIAVNPQNPNQIVLTLGGYGRFGTPVSYVWVISDINNIPTFTPLTGLPKEPAYSSAFVEYEDGGQRKVTLMVGTESGLYSTRDEDYSNATFARELPDDFGNIPVYDIYVRRFQPVILDEESRNFVLREDNTVFIASYGHGVWSTDDLRFTNRRGETETPIQQQVGFDATLTPNPTQGPMSLRFDLPESAQVHVDLYSLDGRRIATVVDQEFSAGSHQLSRSLDGIKAGMYLLRIRAEGQENTYRSTVKAIVQPE